MIFWVKRRILWYVFFSTFHFQKPSLYWLSFFPVISSSMKYYSWKYKGILFITLSVYSKNWLLKIVLQRYICYWGKPWEVLSFNTRIRFRMQNVYWKIKIKSAKENEVLSKKQQKWAAKFILPLWNSELLELISRRADQKSSFIKTPISPWEKVKFLELGKQRCSPYHLKSDNRKYSSINL